MDYCYPNVEYSCERHRQVPRQAALDLSAPAAGRIQPVPIVPPDPGSAGPGHRWFASANTFRKFAGPHDTNGNLKNLVDPTSPFRHGRASHSDSNPAAVANGHLAQRPCDYWSFQARGPWTVTRRDPRVRH